MPRCDARVCERLGVVLAAAILLGVAGLALVATCWRRGSALALLYGVVGVVAAVAAGVAAAAGRDATDELAGSLAATMIGTVLVVIGHLVQRLLDAEQDEGP
jgi:drug/metabolite transporter (DMT)-like permease